MIAGKQLNYLKQLLTLLQSFQIGLCLWNDNTATTQSVSWRTDTSVMSGYAQIGVANASGRSMQTNEFKAVTTLFRSDINDAHYHNVTFTDLEPNTIYAYRVGDGENWTEYYHFKTASIEPKPFSFIYFGDAQNEVKTHWSRPTGGIS